MSLLPWDAGSYDVHALPQDRWGLETLHRLKLVGTERVLDFGCGTGRDVDRLLDALPNGRVVAVDGSPEMLARLRQRIGHRLHRVEIVSADLRDRLPVTPVDAVMSVATLHWLPDHATVFSNIAAVLRPGGRFAAEAGGAGNLAAVLAAVARADPQLREVTSLARAQRKFAGVAETERRLAIAGFTGIHVELVADPMTVPADILEDFLASVILVPELTRIRAPQRAAFVRAVANEIGESLIDWVRLRLTAIRPD